MGSRRRAREQALQMLFQIDLTGSAPEEVFAEFWLASTTDVASRAFAERIVRGVVEDRRELDRWIVGSAEHWRLERMAVVDRNVLRLAVYELLHESDTPPAVVIDEAIEIAKRFGSGESGAFINGILDSIRVRIEERSRSRSEQKTSP